MTILPVGRSALLLGAALGALSAATAAHAQNNANAPVTANDTAALEEVVVTATRQADTVNRVPLAVSAQTQRNLDQRGIRNIADLQSTVPGLRLTAPAGGGANEGAGVGTIAIRGVRQQIGAATTGFYLDETSLQKRAAAGNGSVNGTPIPPLFDLERVEVLRGPQGTLFGGGSEGGTIRYIQPQPSLTRFSEYARAQLMSTKNGDATYDGGFAMGGPIVKDKLGFRASIYGKHTGGFIDLVDYRNGRVYDENANSGKTMLGRLAVTWAPTERSRITANWFSSTEQTDHASASFNLPVTGALTVPSMCYDVPALTALAIGSANRTNPRSFAAGPSCGGRAGQPGIVITPGYTVGPLALKDYQSLVLGPSYQASHLQVMSLDAEYQLTDDLTFKSITSYTHDNNKLSTPNNVLQNNQNYASAGGAIYAAPGQANIVVNSGVSLNPNITATPNGLGLGAYNQSFSNNRRYGLTQEFRFTYAPADGPISFVAGAYFSNTRANVTFYLPGSETGWIQSGALNSVQRFGIPWPGFYTIIHELDKDVEIAGYTEVTGKIGEHWRVTGGLRLTHITTEFDQTHIGPNSYTLEVSEALGTRHDGSVTEDPVTPKASLQYLITPNDILYATAAKGFRAGGVNQAFTASGNSQLFGQYGLPQTVLPTQFSSDSVWSYELGGKFRLWQGRAQLNVSAYQIDWSDVQTTVTLGGDGMVFNVPTARNRGVEVEGQVRPLRFLTLNGNVAWQKGKYTSTVAIPSPRANTLPLTIAANGDLFPQPEWTFDFGARFDANLTSNIKGYARADYRWSKGYLLFPVGNASYSPDSSPVPSQKNINLRFGLEYRDFDLNLFINNVTDEHTGAIGGGRAQCTNTDCSAFVQYNPFRTTNWGLPRQIGVQIAYRH